MAKQNNSQQDSEESSLTNHGKQMGESATQTTESQKEAQDSQETGRETRKAFYPRLNKAGGHLWEVAIEGGGGIPKNLSGLYTSFKRASDAIEAHLHNQEFIENNKRPYHWSRANAAKNKDRNKQIQ